MLRQGFFGMAMALACVGQEGPSPRQDVTRHLERDLQGPRFDLEAESANVAGSPPGISIEVRSGSVSTKTLRRKISKKARQAFDRAAKYSSKRDYRAAADALQEAIRIDPDFV